MTGRFGIGTMHAVFQVVGTVFVEKHALNIMQKKCKQAVQRGTQSVMGPAAQAGLAIVRLQRASSQILNHASALVPNMSTDI